MSQDPRMQKKILENLTRYNQDWSKFTANSTAPQTPTTQTTHSETKNNQPNYSPTNQNEINFDQRLEALKSEIKETEQELFQFKSPYLGWTKDEHNEFLSVLSRFETSLASNLEKISNIQKSRIEFLSKFFPSVGEKKLERHYENFVRRNNLEKKKRDLLEKYKKVKKKVNLLGYAKIQKENEKTENLKMKEEEEKIKMKRKKRSSKERLKIKREIEIWKKKKRQKEKEEKEKNPNILKMNQSKKMFFWKLKK